MKKFRFLIAVICISTGIAGLSNARANSQLVPLCTQTPNAACFGIPDDWGGPIGWYADYAKVE